MSHTMFDRVVRVKATTKNVVDEFRFTVRHANGHRSQRGNTIVVMDAKMHNPIFISHTDQIDNYDKRKGTIACIQKFIWKWYDWHEKVMFDIIGIQFNFDGSIDLEVCARNEETKAEMFWWTSANFTTGKMTV